MLRRKDVVAAAVGVGLAAALFVGTLAIIGFLGREECSGERTPFLGSGPQTFETYGCLARNAGPLIAIKKRLGIYDPAWKPVIK